MPFLGNMFGPGGLGTAPPLPSPFGGLPNPFGGGFPPPLPPGFPSPFPPGFPNPFGGGAQPPPSPGFTPLNTGLSGITPTDPTNPFSGGAHFGPMAQRPQPRPGLPHSNFAGMVPKTTGQAPLIPGQQLPQTQRPPGLVPLGQVAAKGPAQPFGGHIMGGQGMGGPFGQQWVYQTNHQQGSPYYRANPGDPNYGKGGM